MRLLKRSEVTIRTVVTASYGRPVATVDIEGQDLGETLIENGLAVPRPGFLKTDAGRATRYQTAYDRGVAAHAGAHAGYFLDPADWRHGKRLNCEHGPDRY